MKHNVLLAIITAVMAAVGAAAFVGCAPIESDQGAQPPVAADGGEQGYVFTGRVASIVYRGRYRGVAILTTFDSNAGYVVVVEDVQPVSGDVPAGEGNTLAYLIHSPVQLFLAPADEAIGRRYRFTARPSEHMPIVILTTTPADNAN